VRWMTWRAISARPYLPEIKTVTVAGGHGARVVVCSDGVWDVYSSEKAMNALKGYTKPEAAARRICRLAREKREYGGMGLVGWSECCS